MVIEFGYEAVSIQEMVEMYLIGMGQFSDSELRKISEDFVEIKKELGAVSPENVFFEMSMLLNAKKSDRKLGR